MTDQLIREEVAAEVVNDLMDFDRDFPLRSLGELKWLDVRIDHGPLACPVAAHSLASVDVAAFHSIGPDNLLVHRCEECLHIASVEPVVVKTCKKVNFIGIGSPFDNTIGISEREATIKRLERDLRKAQKPTGTKMPEVSAWVEKQLQDVTGLLKSNPAAVKAEFRRLNLKLAFNPIEAEPRPHYVVKASAT